MPACVRREKISNHPWRHAAPRPAVRSGESPIGLRSPYRISDLIVPRSNPSIVPLSLAVSHRGNRTAGLYSLRHHLAPPAVSRDGELRGTGRGTGSKAINRMRRGKLIVVFGHCRKTIDGSAAIANAGTAYLPYRPHIYAGFYSVFRNQSRWISIPFSMQ